MRTCLGLLFLFAVLAETALTVAYHTSINAGIRFEQKESNLEFINTRRSYRPQACSRAEALPAPIPVADHDRF